MRVAVIADIHANLAALDAVLAAVSTQAVGMTVCLGDLVGYGARPGACIERVRASCQVVVAGNHDRDCLQEPRAGTNKAARRALDWTREQLNAEERTYLSGLPPVAHHTSFVAAHGSYLSDIYVSGYVTSTMLEKNLIAIANRPGWPRLALCGHTHVPMMGWLAGGQIEEYASRDHLTWPADAAAVLVNPGSVGQPRDGDPRAAYAVVDVGERRIECHRVPYDVERTCDEIAGAGLPVELADRLREGR